MDFCSSRVSLNVFDWKYLWNTRRRSFRAAPNGTKGSSQAKPILVLLIKSSPAFRKCAYYLLIRVNFGL